MYVILYNFYQCIDMMLKSCVGRNDLFLKLFDFSFSFAWMPNLEEIVNVIYFMKYTCTIFNTQYQSFMHVHNISLSLCFSTGSFRSTCSASFHV